MRYPFEKHFLVCIGSRCNDEKYGSDRGEKIRDELKDLNKKLGRKARTSSSSPRASSTRTSIKKAQSCSIAARWATARSDRTSSLPKPSSGAEAAPPQRSNAGARWIRRK
ncbi:MAG: hypothetical protein ABI837_20620 [Acidobacteriota bacterium]